MHGSGGSGLAHSVNTTGVDPPQALLGKVCDAKMH